jgi:2-keto-4-pentenoate hydratase/2-oxohepta-3-ene-1,7-dioic acid hydratase in catechol pathway
VSRPMKLATFLAPGADGHSAGVVRDDTIVAFSSGTVLDRLAAGDHNPADGPEYALADVTLLAPVPRPRAIFCIGLNYAAHAAESGSELPEVPMVFMKLPGSSVAPHGTVRVPKAAMNRLDYESELAVVMGAGGAIAGYAVADDLSARDLQKAEPRWVRAKGFDSSCPWGPWVTTADEVPNAEDLRITSHVNGEPRQDSRTSDLIFGLEHLIAFISETCTLEPGDLILTGTPEGVGQSMDPPRFLASGDTVRCEIERLGAIEHTIA